MLESQHFKVRIQSELFDMAAEHARLSELSASVGAVVCFTGQVRDTVLELEHYPAMAQKQLEQIMQEARKRWPLIGATLIHRFGRLDVSEQIVLVGVASSHRAASFEAAEFLMDWLKTKAPFWKKDPNGWVEAKDSDDMAAARWCAATASFVKA